MTLKAVISLRAAMRSVDCCKVLFFSRFSSSHSQIKNHCYSQLYPWKSRSKFVDELCKSIVYCKDGVIALNKPYGIRIYNANNTNSDPEKQDERYMSLLASQEDYPYSVEDALPQLKSLLGYPDLQIVKSAERYSSGIVLLAASGKELSRIRKSINIAKVKKIPHLVHWAITKGHPVEFVKKEKVGLKMVDVQFRDEKQPVLVTDYSKTDVKMKRVKTFITEYRALTVNKELNTALLEIAVSSTMWHFIRVYASSRAACIIGDMFYGSRMQTILGRPVKVNPQNIVAYNRQSLSEPMCQKLRILQTNEACETIPTMLHLQSIIMPSNDHKDVIITAPPPYHFQWTCTQLGLLPEELLNKQIYL